MKPISLKKPNRMILEYDDGTIELVTHMKFEHFIFYVDDSTFERVKKYMSFKPMKIPEPGS